MKTKTTSMRKCITKIQACVILQYSDRTFWQQRCNMMPPVCMSSCSVNKQYTLWFLVLFLQRLYSVVFLYMRVYIRTLIPFSTSLRRSYKTSPLTDSGCTHRTTPSKKVDLGTIRCDPEIWLVWCTNSVFKPCVHSGLQQRGNIGFCTHPP